MDILKNPNIGFCGLSICNMHGLNKKERPVDSEPCIQLRTHGHWLKVYFFDILSQDQTCDRPKTVFTAMVNSYQLPSQLFYGLLLTNKILELTHNWLVICMDQCGVSTVQQECIVNLQLVQWPSFYSFVKRSGFTAENLAIFNVHGTCCNNCIKNKQLDTIFLKYNSRLAY